MGRTVGGGALWGQGTAPKWGREQPPPPRIDTQSRCEGSGGTVTHPHSPLGTPRPIGDIRGGQRGHRELSGDTPRATGMSPNTGDILTPTHWGHPQNPPLPPALGGDPPGGTRTPCGQCHQGRIVTHIVSIVPIVPSHFPPPSPPKHLLFLPAQRKSLELALAPASGKSLPGPPGPPGLPGPPGPAGLGPGPLPLTLRFHLPQDSVAEPPPAPQRPTVTPAPVSPMGPRHCPHHHSQRVLVIVPITVPIIVPSVGLHRYPPVGFYHCSQWVVVPNGSPTLSPMGPGRCSPHCPHWVSVIVHSGSVSLMGSHHCPPWVSVTVLSGSSSLSPTGLQWCPH